MSRSHSFAIARFVAHPARDERLNVGLVIFDDRGLDIRPARNLDKLRAITGAIDVEHVREAVSRLNITERAIESKALRSPEDRLLALKSVSALEFSEIGSFESQTASDYEAAISRILSMLVEPEPSPLKPKRSRSKLATSIKATLRSAKILARKGEDLDSHRVVTRWSLAEGLEADFVLKNGAMHVVEAVDAENPDVSSRKVVSDIAVSALVLEQARIIFGETETKGRLVYNASAKNESVAQPSLLAAEHQGAELINWASLDDRTRFFDELLNLAEPIQAKKSSGSINASTQSRFSLN